MQFLFRCDASIQIGTGHVTRSYSLANHLRNQGHQCYFACRSLEGNLISHLISNNFKVFILTSERNSSDPTSLEKADIDSTLKATEGFHFDWIIVDHYLLSSAWETALRARGSRIFVIDDLVGRSHACDLLLDQNLDRSKKSYELGSNASKTRFLSGPEYALIRSEFLEERKSPLHKRPVESDIHILISAGGADPTNLTEFVIGSIANVDLPNKVFISTLLGPSMSNCSDYIKSISSNLSPKGHVYENVSNMASFLRKFHLVIGCAGSSCWERALLGIPMILFSTSENQSLILDSLERRGLCTRSLRENFISIFLQKLESLKRGDLHGESESLSKLVDGLGVIRVERTLVELR